MRTHWVEGFTAGQQTSAAKDSWNPTSKQSVYRDCNTAVETVILLEGNENAMSKCHADVLSIAHAH